MSQLPTLSVVFPNYNHAWFLPEQLNSMLRQSYRPKEIIIIDDASTDNSVEVIEGFVRKEPRIQLIRNENNMGVVWNINRLIEMASGDYIYLSAADDMVLPGFFEKSMALLAKYPEAGLCSAVGRSIDKDGNDLGIRAFPVISNRPCFCSPAQVQRKLCRYGHWFSISSMIIKREALIYEGCQIAELGSFADTFAALVIALRYGACYIPEPMSCRRMLHTGYALRSTTDWGGMIEKGMFAIKLMRTTYRDLFPPEFVAAFKRQWMYALSANIGMQIHVKQERTLKKALETICPETGFVNRVFGYMICLAVRVQAMIWQFYSTIKFAPWRWWIFGRLSILINLRKFLLTERKLRN